MVVKILEPVGVGMVDPFYRDMIVEEGGYHLSLSKVWGLVIPNFQSLEVI